MTIYFGIPVRVKEAIRILNLDLKEITKEVIQTKYYSDYTFVDVANNYLKKISNIQIYYLDKGLCVCGFIVEEPSEVWEKFINVDELIIKLLNLKLLFQKEIEKLNGDLSEVILEYMEGEPEIIKNPIPYVLEWH